VKVFKHNSIKSLEFVLRNCLTKLNNPKKWTKVVIVVEGIGSMEGSIVHLPELIEIKKKYKASTFLKKDQGPGCAFEPNPMLIFHKRQFLDLEIKEYVHGQLNLIID